MMPLAPLCCNAPSASELDQEMPPPFRAQSSSNWCWRSWSCPMQALKPLAMAASMLAMSSSLCLGVGCLDPLDLDLDLVTSALEGRDGGVLPACPEPLAQLEVFNMLSACSPELTASASQEHLPE